MGGFCRILHELGRSPPHVKIRASVPVIFAGVWRVVSPLAGHIRMLGDALPPTQWSGFPHAVRRSFPIIETLDGKVLYPHLTSKASVKSASGGAAATFLALNKVILVKRKSGHSVALNAGLPVASKKGRSCRE